MFDKTYDNEVDKEIANRIIRYRDFKININISELFFVNSLTTLYYVQLNKTLMLTKNIHLFVYCLMIFPRQKTAFVESFAETVGSTNFDFAKKIDFLIIICSC